MKPKKTGPSIPRSVVANMCERYIFNFRVRPDALAPHIPVAWLRPQEVNGWSAVSFCILRADHITLWPIPPLINFATTSCAYRIGVVDVSGSRPEPSVYITDRNADLPIAIRTAPLLFADAIPALRASVSREDGWTRFELRYMDGQRLFFGRTKPTTVLTSRLFDSIDAFASFIKAGVSSYTPSVLPDAYARVDLYKEDVRYEPMHAEVDFSWLDGVWPDAGLEYDSAIFASGARYEWSYRGLWAAK